MTSSRKYVSGIRPSGKLHLGNYLGAIKHWKTLQNTGEDCYFFVADMHVDDSHVVAMATIEALQRCGITVELQSEYRAGLLRLQHELSHKINVAALIRKSHYQEKVDNGDRPSLALLAYPLLMACDILYHNGTHVIVGEDQRIHVEFARDIAEANPYFGFAMPEAVINPVGARIMDLKDPTKKMSKSNPNPDGIIYLCDTKDDIARKIKGAVSTIEGVDNLLDIVRALNGKFDYIGKNAPLKDYVTDLLIKDLCK